MIDAHLRFITWAIAAMCGMGTILVLCDRRNGTGLAAALLGFMALGCAAVAIWKT